MLQYRLDDDQGGPQPKPPGGWKEDGKDKQDKPEKEEEQEKKA